jgi:hypothetical protein
MASRSDKRFQKRKAKQKSDLSRRAARLLERRRALIVCEGEKTEVYYLKALVRSLGLTTADVEVCGDCDSAPIKVVEFGEDKFEDDPDYDLIFFVFDRDAHTTYDEALRKIEELQKNRKFKETDLNAITSIPCFEIWFLLHFEHHDRPYKAGGGKSPCGNLIASLKRKDGFEEYEKGHNGYFELLHGRLPQAKLFASQTLAKSLASGEHKYYGNSTTLMHTLVEALEGVAEEYKR